MQTKMTSQGPHVLLHLVAAFLVLKMMMTRSRNVTAKTLWMKTSDGEEASAKLKTRVMDTTARMS